MVTRYLAPFSLFMVMTVGACKEQQDHAVPQSHELLFALVNTDIPNRDWMNYRKAAQQKAPTAVEAESKLRSALKTLNRANIAEMKTSMGSQSQAALNGMRIKAWQYATRMTASHYLRLGRVISIQLVDALIAFTRHCAKRSVQLESCLTLNHPNDQSYLDLGGTFVLIAQESGLLDGQVMIETKAPLLVGLFMNNWAGLIRDRTTIHSRLRSDERRWYLQWVLEHARSQSLKEKLAAARELESARAYPAAYNAAVLLARDGQKQAALDMAARSSHPEAKKLITRLMSGAKGSTQ